MVGCKELWSLAGLIELVQIHNGVDVADAARKAMKLLGEGWGAPFNHLL